MESLGSVLLSILRYFCKSTARYPEENISPLRFPISASTPINYVGFPEAPYYILLVDFSLGCKGSGVGGTEIPSGLAWEGQSNLPGERTRVNSRR